MRAIVLLLLVSSCYGLFRTQSVAAKGQLRCNNKPEAHSMVELKEKELIRKDLWLNSSETGTSGNFYVIGTASDVWSISPYLTIYHKCPKAKCWKTRYINIPKNYIVEGNKDKVKKVYDTGVVELNSTKGLVRGHDYEDENCKLWYKLMVLDYERNGWKG